MTITTQQRASLRQLPSVHRLLQEDVLRPWIEEFSHEWVAQQAAQFLEEKRQEILHITGQPNLATEHFLQDFIRTLEETKRPHLRSVLNGTGVVLHTNLGRAKLSHRAWQAMQQVALGYSNLEYRLTEGQRGSRYEHVEHLLCQLTGAESALVVNNNASAVFLTLNELAQGKETIVSRGQLVEIGGSFRVSEIMQQSGTHLVEVGTTNKTHLYDYEKAITAETGLLLKVHTSNFKTVGFTEEVSLSDMVSLAHRHSLPVYEDLGSGVLYDLRKHGIGEEPTVQECVTAGADLISFSGDKLLGGPQAGILVGKKEWIDRLKRNQLNRALRVDKLTLAALEATLKAYLVPEKAAKEIPTLRMILTEKDELLQRANQLRSLIDAQFALDLETLVEESESEVGGGSLPSVYLPTFVVSIRPKWSATHQLEKNLRLVEPAVVGRISRDRLILDPRTLEPDEYSPCLNSLAAALKKMKTS